MLLLANFCLLWQEQPSSGGWWSVTPILSSLRMGASPARLGHFLTAWGHFSSQPFLTLLKFHLFSCFSCRLLSVTLHTPTLTCFQAVPGLPETSHPGPDSSLVFYPTGRQHFHLRPHFRWKHIPHGRTQKLAGGLVQGSPGVDRAAVAFAYITLLSFFIPEWLSQSTLVKQSPLTISLATHRLMCFLDSRFSSAQVHTGMQITLLIHRPIDEGSILKKTSPSWTLRGLN